MGLKEEIQKVINVFRLNLDGEKLFNHYEKNIDNFKTKINEKKQLLEGPIVQVMSSIASRGGQKGGDHLIIALLICIFGMTVAIYNKVEDKVEETYRSGSRGRANISGEIKRVRGDIKNIRNNMSSVSKSESENNSKVKENADEGVTGLYNLTPPHVLDTYDRGRRMRQNAMPYGTVPGGQELGGQDNQQSEIYDKKVREAKERGEKKRLQRSRSRQRAAAAERRLAKSKKNGGGRKKKKKRTRKKKRRN